MNMDITQQTEPVRRTFLGVLRDNLKIAGRVSNTLFMTGVDEHKFIKTLGQSIGDCMEKTVLQVNSEYHDEPLSGLLLVYPKYFCHILEGSEDSLNKHLTLLHSVKGHCSEIGTMKLLVCYHHCNKRFLQGWLAIAGKPPTLLERIDANSDIQKTSKYVHDCVKKLYKLAILQRTKLKRLEARGKNKINASPSEFRSTSPPAKFKTRVSFRQEKYLDCLPEIGLLEFLLSSQYTQDLETYFNAFGVIPPMEAYKDKVWPVPCEFVPFNIFDKQYDPVTDLPTAKLEEEVELLDIE